jgi:long-chain acyl-CoA synthetase
VKPDVRIESTVVAEVLRAAEGAGDRVAMQIRRGADWDRVTYSVLAEQVRALGRALAARGVAPGDRVAILSENRPEWGIAFLGALAAGATAVPMDVQLTDREVENVLRHAGVRWALASGAQAARLLAGGAPPVPLNIISLDAEAPSDALALGALLAEGAALTAPLPARAPDDPASILYTSGTTGTPKGVMLSHGNFLANTRSILEFGLAGPSDILLAILPLHHSYAFTITLLMPLLLGARIVYVQTLKGPELLRAMQETGVTILVGVPQLFAMLHRGLFEEVGRKGLAVRVLFRGLARLSESVKASTGWSPGRMFFGQVHRKFGGKIRILASGGARLDPAIAKGFERLGFVLLEGYGLTETAPVLCFNPFARPKYGSVGLPIPEVEIRILNPDAEGVGEVAVRGPNVMLGYYRNPEATAAVMEEGWFKTGDLGYRDKDGYLFLTGRSKEVIVLSSGKNVYPEEVEEHFLQSPFIKEICLVPAGGRGGAEGVRALVLPDFEYFKRHRATVSESYIRWDMENYARTLPPHKRPTALQIVKEPFPRTRLGKIQRHLVQAQYGAAPGAEAVAAGAAAAEAAPSAEDEALLAHQASRKVMGALAHASQKKGPIELGDGLEIDLGLDSLGRLELMVSLEQALGVDLPDELGAEAFTVRELLIKVREYAEGAAVPGGDAAAPPRRTPWSQILAAPPPPDILEAVEHGLGREARWTTRGTRAITAAAFKGIFGLRVRGVENVPATGPLIITPNHDSYLDSFIVGAALPFSALMQLYYLGFEAYFRNAILAWWSRCLRIIPVDLDAHLFRALQASAHVLRQGKILCVFPEGARSIDGTPQPFKRGAAILAKELDVPILPARIRGSFEAWPRFGTLPRPHRLDVVFGKPVTAGELLAMGGPEPDEYDRIAARLRDRVLALD